MNQPFKKIISSVCLTICLLLLVEPTLAHAGYSPRNSKVVYANYKASTAKSINQGKTNWCWAATIANINNLIKPTKVSMETVVVKGKKVNNIKKVSANTAGSTTNIKNAFKSLGISYSYSKSALSLSMIKNQLNNGSPIMVLAKESKGLGHIITIIGYNPYKNSVICLDSNVNVGSVIAPKPAVEYSLPQLQKIWKESYYNFR